MPNGKVSDSIPNLKALIEAEAQREKVLLERLRRSSVGASVTLPCVEIPTHYIGMPPARANEPEASHPEELAPDATADTSLYPPLQVRAGVLVVDGFGIALRVQNRGKLRVEDGIGRQRRSIVLDRAGCGLERLVLIGHAGYVTLEALAWLRAIGAALVQIGRDGEVLAHSVPFGYDGHPIRRAQALAVTNGLDLAIARELIAGKLDGQRRILVRLGADLREFDSMRTALGSADSIEKRARDRGERRRAVFRCVAERAASVSRARPRTNPSTVASLRFASLGTDRRASRGDLAA